MGNVYLIVARTVITDVPEAVGPCPVALMAKVSLPLYLAFALYSKIDKFTFFNLPCAGFCAMPEALTVPFILIGNRQLPPDVRSMSAVEFSPQSASATDIEQSDAAHAEDTDMKLDAPPVSTKAAILDNRVVDILALI
jgi:hypothetical protein